MDERYERLHMYALTDGFLIPRAFLFEIRSHLNRGGLCITPSDTCYGLVGIPILRDVCSDISLILNRGREPMSVVFGTQHLAERFVVFTRANLQLIDEFTPGPLTIIAPIRSDAPDGQIRPLLLGLNKDPADRNLGVRFPDSPPEVQLSTELERPLTTTAILYRDRSPVRNFDDAVEIVIEGMERNGIDRQLCAIRRPGRIGSGALSTVVETTGGSPRAIGYSIIREGAISEDRIRSALSGLDRYVLRDVDEWT
jgi:L-threonylcarbamoyladenylate synthase